MSHDGWAKQLPESPTATTVAVAPTSTALFSAISAKTATTVLVRVKNLDLLQTVTLRLKHSWDGVTDFKDLATINATQLVDPLAAQDYIDILIDMDSLKFVQLYGTASGAGCNVSVIIQRVIYLPNR